MTVLGDWYYPNGTGVANNSEMWEFYRDRGLSVVRLNKRGGGEEGIYHCEIRDELSGGREWRGRKDGDIRDELSGGREWRGREERVGGSTERGG